MMDAQKFDLLQKTCDKLSELAMVYADLADLFLGENKKKLAEKYLDKSEEVMLNSFEEQEYRDCCRFS